MCEKNKIYTLKEIPSLVKQNSATLISGSFDPFNEYYFRLLKWASKQGRPLIVIVQRDKMVLQRRGFTSPLSATHSTRAQIISSLNFVDYVLIENKTAHDTECIKKIKPKTIAFQNDNITYRKKLGEEIKKTYKKLDIKYAPFRLSDFLNRQKLYSINTKQKQDEISKRLLKNTILSNGLHSKITAVLEDKDGKIIAESKNSASEEHAEILLLEEIRKKKLNLDKCTMHILIPPCLMCAKAIAKSSIKKVSYLFPYGDNAGIKYLKRNGITTKHNSTIKQKT